jgi:hypothetical protein
MAAFEGRLSTAPDDYSDVVYGHKTIGTAPVVVRMFAASGTGAGPTLNLYEGADMAQSTRGPDPVDRWTRTSGVNITPPTIAAPVPTTRSVA